jgi:hypothetical protein
MSQVKNINTIAAILCHVTGLRKWLLFTGELQLVTDIQKIDYSMIMFISSQDQTTVVTPLTGVRNNIL